MRGDAKFKVCNGRPQYPQETGDDNVDAVWSASLVPRQDEASLRLVMALRKARTPSREEDEMRGTTSNISPTASRQSFGRVASATHFLQSDSS
eukprot:CAMPEP_0170653346 /NCGR_PEP_ID=MMETSP0224-20130122/47359_1 /TAXON_ID=285029 /ORGANISM="Togula jolla, Strain CCCM 725" /LENGTH=92 /DNA_ID=CAMNT_0010985213 /DNA_START=225 /DNA_END=503 /DNA_ORIENTATION=-